MVALIYFDASSNISFFSLAFTSFLHVKQKNCLLLFTHMFFHAPCLIKNVFNMSPLLKIKNRENKSLLAVF